MDSELFFTLLLSMCPAAIGPSPKHLTSHVLNVVEGYDKYCGRKKWLFWHLNCYAKLGQEQANKLIVAGLFVDISSLSLRYDDSIEPFASLSLSLSLSLSRPCYGKPLHLLSCPDGPQHLHRVDEHNFLQVGQHWCVHA